MKDKNFNSSQKISLSPIPIFFQKYDNHAESIIGLEKKKQTKNSFAEIDNKTLTSGHIIWLTTLRCAKLENIYL